MSTSHFNDLLLLFESLEVKYLVIGGYAVMLYTEPRFTKDLDVWVEPSNENASRVFQALARFGAPLGDVTPSDFTIENQVFQMGVAPVRIDVLTTITGVTFSEAWEARVRRSFLGNPVWFIGRDHLIRNKLASGRPLDLFDADNLKLSQAHPLKEVAE